MTKFDFDTAPDRRNSGSYKWDSEPPAAPGAELLPMWVADMDFRTAPCIIEALRARVDHGVFGYTYIPESYYKALENWFRDRHGYAVSRDKIIVVPGVVPAISAIIKALTKPGMGVVVQTPVYNCFFSSIRNNGCRVVENPLIRKNYPDGTFSYEMDFEDLDNLTADPAVNLLLLCNPHNPAGRAWTRAELLKVAEICSRNGVTVISDEIHCDLTLPGNKFTSYATLGEEFMSRAIICNSPSKAFNTAGLQVANIICGSETLRALVDRAVNDNEVCDVNPFGVTGLVAAYTQGGPWLEALLAYLKENYATFTAFMRRELPFLPFARLEATYLAWIDCSSLGVPSDDLESLLIEKCGVWLNAGAMYGDDRFMRVNLACPKERLVTALERIAPVLRMLNGC